jgi:glyoxylase-like metal-dependent hydrolase (beta-lactamase superfamily II)
VHSLRRFLLTWLAIASAAIGLAGCNTVRAAAPAAAALPVAAGSAPISIAPGVYMLQGASGEPDTDNLGRIGNAGFIVGDDGVIAIDTGTSYRHGAALLAQIRRVTDKPIKLVVITHTRQEFLFGALAYREQGIPIHMHRQAAGLMRSRCDKCLKTLNQILGGDAMQGTAMFTPDVEFDAATTLDLIGRPVQLLYFGHSAGPGDVAVFDARSGVLFAGGLLDVQRIPDVQDSDLMGWSKALTALHALPIRQIVPGHGPASSPKAIDAVERYLVQLRSRVQDLLRAGTALSEVPDATALPEFAQWDQYETIHRRNASVLFVRFEREQMFKRAGAPE